MSRVYVGGLPEDVSAREVEDIFYKFGRIRDIDIKIPRGPGPTFGFVEFSDSRDAEDAVRDRDGYRFDGRRLRVEFSRARGGAGGFGGGGGGPRRGGSEYRVAVSGLPISASWQDLKDHFRRAGDVGFADVNRDGTGVVEYSNRADMENAIRKLDGSEFDNRADRATISVREAGGSGGGGGGGRGRSPSPRRRSPSPRRSASPRRGSSRDRSRDRGGRSADRSPRRSRSRDRDAAARSRSRSPSPEKRRSASGSPAPAPSSPRD